MPRPVRFAFTLAASLLASTLVAQTPAKAGIQPQDIDKQVTPGDNFYLYANGEWQQRTEIPPDRTGLTSFSIVDRKVQAQLKEIFDNLSATTAAAGSDKKKLADFYASFMDTAAIDRNGLKNLHPRLAALADIHDRTDLAHALGLTLRADTDALNNTNFHTPNLLGLWVAPGFNDPGHYAPYLMQGGTQLPSQAYYLSDSEHMRAVRAAYRKHIAKVFLLAGVAHDPADADARAERVLALETAIARVQLSLADSENIKKANNLWRTAEFAAKAPGLDWAAYFASAGLSSQREFYVWQPTAIIAESALTASQPLENWRDLLTFHALESVSTGLSQSLADEAFQFYGVTLTGAPQQRPREQRAIAAANAAMGDAVGQLYVARYFSPEAKARAQTLVRNLLAAFHRRLEANTWLAPSTKAEAIRKLDSLRVGIGYPDHWRSYAGLQIRADDLAGNLQRSSLFDYHYNVGRIGKATDRGEWTMEPQLVNAVNLPLDNGLNFPAAILQPPFFDAAAPDAYNYGAIGSVMGHEISHTFDSEGAAFDSDGKVRDWWTPADFAHFEQLTAALAAQYDTYEPFPGQHVNGRQTLGEDIADLGGLAAAGEAYTTALAGKTAPQVDGYTGEQQFYLAFGQLWRNKTREAAARAQLLTDPHAPGQYRAETVRNFDAWYRAFDVKPGQKLYLAPAERIHIW